MELIPRKRRKRGRPRKTWMERVQATMTKIFKTRSVEKQRGMAFGLWKKATAVKKNG
jgi:hypothetical protein